MEIGVRHLGPVVKHLLSLKGDRRKKKVSFLSLTEMYCPTVQAYTVSLQTLFHLLVVESLIPTEGNILTDKICFKVQSVQSFAPTHS